MNQKNFFLGLFCLFLIFLTTGYAAEGKASVPFDHSDWDRFLKKFVDEKGEVDYQGALKEKEPLRAYIEKFKSISPKAFQEGSREERIAIFINGYNASVIKLILDHYPVKSILEIPGFWDQTVIQIRTSPKSPTPNSYSLNGLQEELLRRTFRDEKILFALSSGAKGSPPLQPEAYTPSRLEGRLYRAARHFVNDEARNQIVPGKKKIVLSRLFKWNGNDFLLNWGDFPQESRWKPAEMAVLSFFAHYLEDPKKVEFLKEGRYKVTYAPFDWRLNDRVKSPESPKSFDKGSKFS